VTVPAENAPNKIQALLDRGFDCVSSRRFEDASPYFEEVIQLAPDSARAYFGRGVCRHSTCDVEGAIADYDAAIRLDPNLAKAYINRGLLRIGEADVEPAIADFNAALAVDSGNAKAYQHRGIARLRQGEHAKALSDFSAALRIEPGAAEVYFLRANVYEALGHHEDAVRDLDQAIRFDPRMAEAFARRGQLLQGGGVYKQAQEDLQRAGELNVRTEVQTPMSGKPTYIALLLQQHFHPERIDALTITERKFPFRVRADLQRAIDRLFKGTEAVRHFGGVLQRYKQDGLSISALSLHNQHDPAVTAAPEYEEVDIGEDESVRCLKVGLWLLADEESKFAVLLAPSTFHGRATGIQLQVATLNNLNGARITQDFFQKLEDAVQQSKSYRGKILSLEGQLDYTGRTTGIKVHRLRSVAREDVILPRKTLDLLDRNVISFSHQKHRLAQLGLSTKKGLLFYGPPGTGKTHTIHYLAGALEGYTTFLIAAEQVGLLEEYMLVARLLQPSLVVIEDVDLIARDRTKMGNACEELLLNKLLNEMDGLKPDADILFILTTNRPESLETALTGRPGRVDQAIEFPLPDEAGRVKLIQLYAAGMSVPEPVLRSTAKKTEKVSASFIKELMRRTAQFHIERGDPSPEIREDDVNSALDELLFTGGSLNRKLLGAQEDARAVD
jgi:cell division protease FtsH